MPRKYVVVSSTSSSDLSVQYSSEYSGSDSESPDERRNRRERRRRHDRSPRGSKEPSESLHWWLARWLSSEFAKFAISVYEGGKGCIRYLSNTALQALPSAETAKELQEEISGARRTRHNRKRRNSPYPGGSGESVEVGKSGKSQFKSSHGRKERPSSPDEAYFSLNHRKGSKLGHRSPFSMKKQGSSRSRNRHSFNENWIYEENWIENLLKEVKSNFKNPVKVKVYKVIPGEGPSSKSRSDNSQTDSKLSISIEELVSPTYPSGNSDLVSTSSGRVRSETADLATEASVPKTRCEKKVVSSSSRPIRASGGSASARLESKRQNGELEKMSVSKTPHRTSTVRFAPSDLTVLSGGHKDGRSSSPTDPSYENKSSDSAYCKEGNVFYPAPYRKCRVVCEDVPGSGVAVDSEQSLVQDEQGSGLVYPKLVGTDSEIEDSQILLAMQSDDLNDPELDEHKASRKQDADVVFSGVSDIISIDYSNVSANDTPGEEREMGSEEFNVHSIERRTSCHCSRTRIKETEVESNLEKDDSCSGELGEPKRRSSSTSDVFQKPPSITVSPSPEKQLPPASYAELHQPRWELMEPSTGTLEWQKQNQHVASSQRLGLSDGRMIEKVSEVSLRKSASSRNWRASVPSASSQPPLRRISNNEQHAVRTGSEESGMETIKSITLGGPSSSRQVGAIGSSASMKKLRDIGLMEPQDISVYQLQKKVPEPEHIPGSPSSASVKTTGDEPRLLFLSTVRRGESTETCGVEVSGVSMLNNTIGAGGTPFCEPSGSTSSNVGTVVAGNQAPSELDVKDLKQVGSVTQPLHVNPEVPVPGRLLFLAEGSKDCSSTTRVTIEDFKSVSPSSPRKSILKDLTSSSSEVSSADRLKRPSTAELTAEYEAVHPDLARRSLEEFMDVIEDKTLSSPSLRRTSRGSLPDSLKSGAVPAGVSSVSAISDPSGEIAVVASKTGKSSGTQSDRTSKSTFQSAESTVESFNSKFTDATRTESATSSGRLPGGSQKDLISPVGSSHYTRSKEGGFSNSEERTPSGGSEFTLYYGNQERDSSHSAHLGSNEPLNQMQSSVPVIGTASKATIGSAADADGALVVNAGGSSKADSSTEQGSEPPSNFVVEEKESSQAESLSIVSNDASVETVRLKEQLAEAASLASEDVSTTMQDSDAVSVSLKSISESHGEPELHVPGHLTFGEVEKMSYVMNTFEASSSQTIKVPLQERFKVLERPSISKANLPPIEEEVEPENSSKDPSSSIVQQRRPSMIAPGLLKVKSHPLTVPSAESTAPAYVGDESDVSFPESSQSLSASDLCPCKKICDLCTCDRRASEKPSLTISGSVAKGRPLGKSFSKSRRPRVGAIDMSSTPFPKNSFDVLGSPFYAHWDYYDLDQNHPIARYVRRPDQAEFGNTDTILMKNVRVGGYTIPYMKLQTKEKVTSKMVCNFYKTRKLPFRGKDNPKGIAMDSKDSFAEKSSDSMLGKEESKEKKKCQCKKAREENIWKDYTRDDRAGMLDFPTDVFLERSRCTHSGEEGCTCIDLPEHARTVPAPGTPCESCDCFISDVELESAPQIGIRSSGLPESYDSEDSTVDKAAIVNEYICGLQELCSNLCAMIGKMRLVIDDTSSPSGSTSRSVKSPLSRPSPRKSPYRELPDQQGPESYAAPQPDP